MLEHINLELTDMFTGEKEAIPLGALYPELDKGKVLNEYLKCGQLTDKIKLAETIMKKMPQVQIETKHDFSFGVYARTIFIPKGVILTGHTHMFENLNILLKGKIQVSIGDKIETIEAPFVVVSPANTKRIAEALEDCIWMTILGTHEQNIDVIEDYFLIKDDNQLKLPGF